MVIYIIWDEQCEKSFFYRKLLFFREKHDGAFDCTLL